MDLFASIGERLREVREEMGLSQTEFVAISERAGVVGTTRQTQSNYEKGKRMPDAAYLWAIAAAGADIQYIVTGARQKMLPAPALNKQLLQQIMEGVEETLTKRRKAIAPSKKAELVHLLYEHFAPKGKIVEEEFRSYLKLVA